MNAAFKFAISILGAFMIYLIIPAAEALEMQACTQMACENGLQAQFPDKYVWLPGAYRFEFTLDKRKIICKGSLPLKSCETPSLKCTPATPELSIMESGCALPPKAHGFGRIQLSSLPKQFRLQIYRNDRKIAQSEVKPNYRKVEPNGSGCGGNCEQASVKIEISR